MSLMMGLRSSVPFDPQPLGMVCMEYGQRSAQGPSSLESSLSAWYARSFPAVVIAIEIRQPIPFPSSFT